MERCLVAARTANEKRLRELRRLIEARGLSGIILFEGDNMAYKVALTRHFNAVLVVPGNVYVITDATLYHVALEESPWNVVLVEDFALEELKRKLLALLGGPKDAQRLVIGVNKAWGRTRTSFLYVDLLEALRSSGIEAIDATDILAQVFDKPFEEEQAIIKWISSVASRALQSIEEALRPGMSEYEVAAIADKVLDENGVTDRWFATIVASGPRAASPHAKTSTRRIAEGDPVIVDLGPLWMGYDGCVAHTFIAGRSSYWERIVEDVAEALRSGLKHAEPGAPVRVLDETPRSILKERGYPDYPHLTGHPIGGFYKPVIADFVDYELEPGMVFAYEPAVYITGRGGVRIEPHVLITRHGSLVLTEYHRQVL